MVKPQEAYLTFFCLLFTLMYSHAEKVMDDTYIKM